MASCNKELHSSLPEIDAQEVNTVFQLTEPPVLSNSHRNGDVLALQLKNISDIPIVFPSGFGVKILAQQNHSWVPVENKLSYPEVESILPLNSMDLSGIVLTLIPFVPDLHEPVIVRIMVFGKKENADDTVGGYIDINLSP